MEDGTRLKAAKGGIYKGQSVNVPHQKQHNKAHNAATKAVHRMLINDGMILCICYGKIVTLSMKVACY